MRRTAPRTIAAALRGALHEAEPAGLLPAVQAHWAELVGPVVARESERVSERDGLVHEACSSAAWAQELELLGADLVARLNARMGASAGTGSVRGLRFSTGRPGRP